MKNDVQNGGQTTVDTEVKQSWHPPTIEEIDYSATELGGAPGAFPEGYSSYSTP